MQEEIKILLADPTQTPEIVTSIINLRGMAWRDSDLAGYHVQNHITDLLEPCSVHFLAMENNMLVASARVTALSKEMSILLSEEEKHLFDFSKNPVLFSRLATLPMYRNRGVAKQLTMARLDFVEQHTKVAYDIFTFARNSIAPYYKQEFGFQKIKKMNIPYPNSCLLRLIK